MISAIDGYGLFASKFITFFNCGPVLTPLRWVITGSLQLWSFYELRVK